MNKKSNKSSCFNISSNMLNPVDNQIRDLLKSGLETLERQLDSDIYTYYGPIEDSIVPEIGRAHV